MMVIAHVTALTLAYLLDLLFGDPRTKYHPVVLMGNMISTFERLFNKGRARKWKGLIATLIPGLAIAMIVFLFMAVAYHVHLAIGVLLEACILWGCIGGKSMISHIENIYEHLENRQIKAARQETAMIVSRDTTQLSEEEMVRASLESIGENISDSVTAPMLYALIGGAPLAVFYRFMNTSDAMIGYRTSRYEQYGWGAARIDDVLNLIPSRITALCMTTAVWYVNQTKWLQAFKVTWEHAKLHESPNAGYGEAAMAGILNVRLGGPTKYRGEMIDRPFFGRGERKLDIPCLQDGLLVWRVTLVHFIVFLWMFGGVTWLTQSVLS
ncbi:adenosylcobinamide-phosphate synthase CbiB [Alteribacillus iranensis]|uniref:Cobalamin biosynthesis protein CobD n=1 Tax=Alteribacillus iranensis TaxID=930128 RepID=A0A1I1ZMW8_9BACI|nr:adenosylcobinamide-phosphate synthase CbiB [Alteribacillus iranensis]SFE33031.1 adenosylcobinamide-phosphate synthase [Alteribacillus iranensis]